MRYRADRYRTHVWNNTEGALGGPDVAFELLLERGFGPSRSPPECRTGRTPGSAVLRHRLGGHRPGAEEWVGGKPLRRSFLVSEMADIGSGKACCQ